MNQKIGIVSMPDISVGGGFPKVVRDLINGLNILRKEVYFLSPFKINLKKITDFYGPFKIKKSYQCSKLKRIFCREDTLARKIIKKEFQKMAKEVDMIIDMDGRILHNYLPKNSDKPKYIMWWVSPAYSDMERFPDLPKSFKRKIKNIIRKTLELKRDPPSKKHKIYTLDNWTENDLIKYWGLIPEKHHLYPEVKIDEFFYDKKRKKDQIIVFGRIAANKRIDDSIKIFYHGTKGKPNYKLIIFGGTTSDSEYHIKYLKNIIENLGISKRVKIVENPSFDELKKILLDSKVLIDSEQGESTTITSIEALACGSIILSSKQDFGTWWEFLENGKYGFGFDDIEDGGKKLKMILEKLEKNTLSPKKFMKKTNFYSHENFIKRLRKIVNER